HEDGSLGGPNVSSEDLSALEGENARPVHVDRQPELRPRLIAQKGDDALGAGIEAKGTIGVGGEDLGERVARTHDREKCVTELPQRSGIFAFSGLTPRRNAA